MNEVLREVFMYMFSFVAIIVLFFLLVNFLTKGFLWKYLFVKASQGRKILVRVHSSIELYYAVGSWKKSFLNYKTKGKETKMIPISDADFRGAIFYTMGVPLIEVDENSNKILMNDLSVAQFQVDGGTTETIMLRFKNRPAATNKKDNIMFLLLGVCIIGIIVLLVMIHNQGEAINSITSLVGNI